MRIQRKAYHMSAEKILALGFACMILTGAILLNTPFASANGEKIGFLNALFTATSATSVTGLVTVDIANELTLFGKIIVLLLIQTGGLGFMMMGTIILVVLGRRISLKNRLFIRDTFNTESLSGSVRLVRRGVIFALSLEFIGAAILSIRFIKLYGFASGVGIAIFTSISAFCNAGIDLFGNFESMSRFSNDPLVLITVALLIILGGLGFIVLDDLINKKFQFKKLYLHSKIVLTMTACLLVFGALILYITEIDNVRYWGDRSVLNKILNVSFHSAVLRSAGFSSLNYAYNTNAGKILSVIWMFIGSSPASTGGGIKTTTMFLLLMQTYTVIRANEEIQVFSKTISKKQSLKAIAIVATFLILVIVGTMFICGFEKNTDRLAIDILYEAMSAIGNVGLSTSDIRSYSVQSQIVLIIIMFVGRVGPLTMAYAIGNSEQGASKIQFPEERIIIG